MKRWLRRTIVCSLAFAAGWWTYGRLEASLDTPPTSGPAAVDPETSARVDAWLTRVTARHAGPLDLAGEVSADFDVAGMVEARKVAFVAGFESAGRFAHTMEQDSAVAVREGRYTLVDLERNRFVRGEVGEALPSPILEMLGQQNPALLVAVLGSARDALLPAGTVVTRLDVGDDLVTLATERDGVGVDYDFDPADARLLRARFSYRRHLESRGVAAVRRADVVVAYGAPDASAARHLDVAIPEKATDLSPTTAPADDNLRELLGE